jgi:hypothetical protein
MMFPKLLAGAVGIGAIVGTSATQVGQVQNGVSPGGRRARGHS